MCACKSCLETRVHRIYTEMQTIFNISSFNRYNSVFLLSLLLTAFPISLLIYTIYLEFIYAAPFITHSSNFELWMSAWNFIAYAFFSLFCRHRYSINSSLIITEFGSFVSWRLRGSTYTVCVIEFDRKRERACNIPYELNICWNSSPALSIQFSLWFEHVRWIPFDWFMIDKSHFYLIRFLFVCFSRMKLCAYSFFVSPLCMYACLLVCVWNSALKLLWIVVTIVSYSLSLYWHKFSFYSRGFRQLSMSFA